MAPSYQEELPYHHQDDYEPLPSSTAPLLAPTPPRRRRRPSSVILFLLVGLLGLVVFALVRNGGDHQESKMRAPPQVEMLASAVRGVAEGVSAKTYTPVLGAPAFSWTNVLLTWQRTGFHFQPQKNWMNGN